jgi:hypothetical protein
MKLNGSKYGIGKHQFVKQYSGKKSAIDCTTGKHFIHSLLARNRVFSTTKK